MGYLNNPFLILHISSPFSSKKWFQRLGKFLLKQNRSVVVEFSIVITLISALRRLRFLVTLAQCNVGIIQDVANPYEYSLKPLKAPICYYSACIGHTIFDHRCHSHTGYELWQLSVDVPCLNSASLPADLRSKNSFQFCASKTDRCLTGTNPNYHY